MHDRLLSQIPAILAALAAAVGLGLAGAPALAQAAAGALAGIGAALLFAPAEGEETPADRPAAGAEAMPTGAGRHVLEQLPSPLVMIDSHGRIIFANPAARALFERMRLGEHYSLSFRHPDLLAAIGEAMETGAGRTFEFNRPGDQALLLRAHVNAAPQAENSDDWPRVVCLFEDRTRDRQAEQLRTDFIANASHELRTPLSSIKGFIETLRGPARDDTKAREEFLGVMAAQADRMHRLVDDLLSLSRIEMNERQPPEGETHLGDVVSEVVAALSPVAEARGAAIEVETARPGPRIRADHDQLCQALGNLVENALKYGRPGAPVRIVPAPPSPDHPGMTGVTVVDEGEGVAREHIPRLTERFYRVSPKRSRDLGGTGLGLAIVKHIAHRHRGEIEVKSEIGVGSRFTLWLPPAPPDEPETLNPEP